MMIVLVILTIVSTITFAGLSTQNFDSAFREYGNDLEAAIIQARDIAIDEQTRVDVTVTANALTIAVEDNETKAWANWYQYRLIDYGAGQLQNDACIRGFYGGIQAAKGAVNTTFPAVCLTSPQTVRFFPDGTFEVTSATPTMARDDMGVVLVLADTRTEPTYTEVQIWPGGTIRKLDNVRNAGS